MALISDPITAGIDLAKVVVGKIWPDKTQQEQAELAAAVALVQGQMQVNAAEAASGSAYAAGWRPTVGYVCVAGLGYTFLLQPLLPWVAKICGADVPPLPNLDNGALMTLLLGMLGIGGLRSIEKVKGVA
jgi:hypothetical protein